MLELLDMLDTTLESVRLRLRLRLMLMLSMATLLLLLTLVQDVKPTLKGSANKSQFRLLAPFLVRSVFLFPARSVSQSPMRSVSLFRAKSATLLSAMYQRRSVCPALSPDVSPPQGLSKMLPATPSRFQFQGLFPEKCVMQSPDKSAIQFSRRFHCPDVSPPQGLSKML